MKPKPLKNKIIKGNDFGFKDLVEVKDIKSAVEWLKESIRLTTYNELKLSTNEQKLIKDEIISFIDEAFEDVTKNKKAMRDK